MATQQIFRHREVTGAFRTLLRTVHQVFRGDAHALNQSTIEVRNQFRLNARESDPTAIARMVEDAHEAAEFLKMSVVQGKMNDAGRYEIALKSDMAEEGMDALRLQDAKTAKDASAGGSGGGGGGGGCGREGGCSCKGSPAATPEGEGTKNGGCGQNSKGGCSTCS